MAKFISFIVIDTNNKKSKITINADYIRIIIPDEKESVFEQTLLWVDGINSAYTVVDPYDYVIQRLRSEVSYK